MKTKNHKADSVGIITLGCAKNLVDSENLLTQLRSNDIEADHEGGNPNPNVIIINTCGFIENAKQESIDTILSYADLRKEGAIDRLFVTGCLSERYKDSLRDEIPEVDDYFGTRDMPGLLRKFGVDYKHELVGERIASTPKQFAYVKIAEGCDRPCSFCAIPLMRGKHVSRKIEDLVEEAKQLAGKGTKELILIAQDLTYYGLDLYKKRELANLVDKLSEVDGIEWIRLHYAYPSGFPMDVLDVMRERDNVCNYLDIPLQHGSSKILQLMRRGITREKTEDLIHQIREKVPGISIRTTLIAGHPGEGEAEFEEMLTFVENMRFDRLGIFHYSHEENTHSFSMEDDVPEEVKEERAQIVMTTQESISHELNQKKVGHVFKTMIDAKEGNYYIGRTFADSPEVDNEVIVDATNNYLSLGDFVNIQVNRAEAFDLYGEVAE